MTSKILVLTFAVLIGFSAVIATSTSVEAADFWSDLVGGIEEWFRISPFSGMFDTPSNEVTYVNLVFYPDNFTMEPVGSFNAASAGFEFYNFAGTVSFEPSVGVVTFLQKENDMKVVGYLRDNITIPNLKLSKIILDNVMLEITSGNWTETTASGSAEFSDFSGDAKFFNDRIELSGNVTRILKK